jgi:hypothetical protein
MLDTWWTRLCAAWTNGDLFVEAVFGGIPFLIGIPAVFLRKKIRSFFGTFVAHWSAKAFRFWPETLFGAIALGLVAFMAWISLKSETAEAAQAALVAGSGLLGVYVVLQEYRFARKASYSEVMRSLHMVVHNLRDRFDGLEGMSDREFEGTIGDAMDGVARAFSIVTRTNCRASVKVISTNVPDIATRPMNQRVRELMVKTLARDCQSSISPLDSEAEFLDENEDFRTVFSNAQARCFFENDLISRARQGKYYNSHLPEEFDPHQDEWQLPYRATIVWPIRKVGASETHPGHHVLGFLCVDAPSRYAFARRYDFEMGALVADALYTYIDARLKALAALAAAP